MIKPTVGRVLWYYPYGATQVAAGEQPLSAQIAFVHHDRLVNIGYLNANGMPLSATSVPLLQDDDQPPPHGFCMWMPYQVGQAQRTQAAEAALAAAN